MTADPPKHLTPSSNSGFFLSLFLSRFADQIVVFLVPLVIFQQTGSITWSGIAFVVETLPRYLLFPLCGILCDRVPAWQLIRLSQGGRAASCLLGLIGFAAITGVAWLVIISTAIGIFSTLGFMAREVMLPQVFAHQRFERVASTTQIADQLGTILGPLAAAAMLGIVTWQWVIFAATLIFVCADLSLVAWQRFTRPTFAVLEPSSRSVIAPLSIAATQILRLPGLLRLVSLTAAVNLIIGVTLATSAAMATGVHGQSDADYALLQAAGAVATVLVLLTIAHVEIPLPKLGLAAFSIIVAGGLITALSSGPISYAVGFILIVSFDKMFNVFIRTNRQRIIPRKDLGKTTGLIVMLNNLSQPFAGLCVTMFAEYHGVQFVIFGLSAVAGLTGTSVAIASKLLRRPA